MVTPALCVVCGHKNSKHRDFKGACRECTCTAFQGVQLTVTGRLPFTPPFHHMPTQSRKPKLVGVSVDYAKLELRAAALISKEFKRLANKKGKS